MKKFNHVIVRRPCRAMVDGITSAPELGKPDYELALKEHDAYIEALKQCDVDVTVLEADERYPDSCFVEDPALITRECAIITNPGAESRNGEKFEIVDAVRKFFPEDRIEYIKAPGTLGRRRCYDGKETISMLERFRKNKRRRNPPVNGNPCKIRNDMFRSKA